MISVVRLARFPSLWQEARPCTSCSDNPDAQALCAWARAAAASASAPAPLMGVWSHPAGKGSAQDYKAKHTWRCEVVPACVTAVHTPSGHSLQAFSTMLGQTYQTNNSAKECRGIRVGSAAHSTLRYVRRSDTYMWTLISNYTVDVKDPAKM